ncbi:hypothetical protein QEW_4263 [Clostridioides difficile CD160]|nr:hypothetical protein QEW_4263 [Clostridioides difficile CD160]
MRLFFGLFWGLDKSKDKHFKQENKKYIQKVISKKECKYLEQINDILFDFGEIRV